MTQPGVRATPQGTLVDRALRYLGDQSADSLTLARDVLGIARATRAIADRVAVALLGADPRVQRLRDGRWALAAKAERSAVLSSCTFAVVDVETTGSRAGRGDRVTEIAVVTLSDGEIDVTLDALVNPERPIPSIVSRLTRITDDMVRSQPTFADVADDVLEALAGRVFAAHNARFDWAFLSRELRRTKDLALEGPRICTVHLARRLIPGLRSRGLDSVAAYFGVEIENRHRAGGDAVATARILQRLLELAGEKGVTTLGELRELGRRRRPRKTALPTSVKEI
jgi:DNA polymerase-3 subunit epsilon